MPEKLVLEWSYGGTGIQKLRRTLWIPAFAGKTAKERKQIFNGLVLLVSRENRVLWSCSNT